MMNIQNIIRETGGEFSIKVILMESILRYVLEILFINLETLQEPVITQKVIRSIQDT